MSQLFFTRNYIRNLEEAYDLPLNLTRHKQGHFSLEIALEAEKEPLRTKEHSN